MNHLTLIVEKHRVERNIPALIKIRQDIMSLTSSVTEKVRELTEAKLQAYVELQNLVEAQSIFCLVQGAIDEILSIPTWKTHK